MWIVKNIDNKGFNYKSYYNFNIKTRQKYISI